MSQTADRCCTGERGNCLHFTITAGNGCLCPIAALRSVFPPGQDKSPDPPWGWNAARPRLAAYEKWHSKSKRTIVTAQGDGAPESGRNQK